MLLQDRVAVITGAGRGIGRAIAILFVEEGASVVVNDLDGEALAETQSACRAIGGAVAVSVGSIAQPAYAAELMATAARSFGKLDILINNAGITRDAMVHKMSDESWFEVMQTNLTGTFNCCRATVPYLRDVAKAELARTGAVSHHRKIVNFSSTAAINGNVGQANYAAAKLGNVGLTRSLAREWAPFRINVNALAPGFTDTRLTQEKGSASEGLGLPADQREAFLKRLPFGRPAAPLDIARVALFFASPLSDWVTGQLINASGGHQIP